MSIHTIRKLCALNSKITRQSRKQARTGAAVVEFAIVGPLMIMLTMGMMEVGRAVMVKQLMVNASREGARMAILPSASSQTVIAQVQAQLAASFDQWDHRHAHSTLFGQRTSGYSRDRCHFCECQSSELDSESSIYLESNHYHSNDDAPREFVSSVRCVIPSGFARCIVKRLPMRMHQARDINCNVDTLGNCVSPSLRLLRGEGAGG